MRPCSTFALPTASWSPAQRFVLLLTTSCPLGIHDYLSIKYAHDASLLVPTVSVEHVVTYVVGWVRQNKIIVNLLKSVCRRAKLFLLLPDTIEVLLGILFRYDCSSVILQSQEIVWKLVHLLNDKWFVELDVKLSSLTHLLCLPTRVWPGWVDHVVSTSASDCLERLVSE